MNLTSFIFFLLSLIHGMPRNLVKGFLRISNIKQQQQQKCSSITKKFGFGFGKVDEEKDPGAIEGTKLRILKYPHPLLRTINEEVTVFDEELKRTADEMLLVMHASNGIGLAAPQVGINKRLMVFSLSDGGKDLALVNPSILSTAEEVETEEEGCLSFPQINGDVTRPAWVEVQYQSLTGEKFRQRFKSFEARVFQHEFDHLQKVLFFERFNDKDRGSNKKRLEKMVKKFGPDAKP